MFGAGYFGGIYFGEPSAGVPSSTFSITGVSRISSTGASVRFTLIQGRAKIARQTVSLKKIFYIHGHSRISH